MKSWKLMLGLGAACAACCAIPLLGAAGGLAVFASALWACADEFIPAAIGLGAFASALLALWLWRKRRSAQANTCACTTSCSTRASHVLT
jgi:hypothetical protein